jgi:hypothetical protein
VGDTPEEQRENFERYAIGVREAWKREQEALKYDLELSEMNKGSPASRHLAHLALQKVRRGLRLVE